ncbi:MAG: hypothetical protein V3S62_03815 [Acidimicrobiia bacterium]
MTGSRGIGRVIVVGMALLLVTAACGDDAAADPDRFCEINADLNALDDPFDSSPDAARAIVREGRALLDEAVRVTPDEIRDTVDLAAESFRLFLDFAEAADFDPERVSLEDVEAAFSAESIAAGEAIDEWAEANCSN